MWEEKYFYRKPCLNDLSRKHLLYNHFNKVNKCISRTPIIFKLDFVSLSVMIYWAAAAGYWMEREIDTAPAWRICKRN